MKESYRYHNWRTGIILGVIVAGALLLRAWHIHFVLEVHDLRDAPIHADARQYIKYGYNLVYNSVYSMDFPSSHPKPDAFRSPGYPLLIASSMRLADGLDFIPTILYLQAIIGAVTVLLTYLLAKHFTSKSLALVAATLVGLSPHLIAISAYILTETLASFLIVAALLSFQKAFKGGGLFWYAIAGMLFGWGYLTNETLLFLPFIIGGVTLIHTIKPLVTNRKNLLPMAVFISAFCVFPSIWLTRNASVLPKDALTGYHRAVQTMSHGAYPGFIHESVEKKYYPYLEDPLQPQFGSSIRDFSHILWQRVRQRPLRYLSWYLVEKPYYFWSWNILQGQGDVFVYPVKTSLYTESRLAKIKKGMMKFFHPVILLLSIVGIPPLLIKFLHRGRRHSLQGTPVFIYATCLYFTVVFTVFAPWPRYSIMLRPELYICAVWSLAQCIAAIKMNRPLNLWLY